MTGIQNRTQEDHKKDKLALYHWLLGRNFAVAAYALDYASKYHNQLRKNNLTPEFNHQVMIGQYIRTLNAYLTYPEETFAAIFLHDICEDYDISYNDLKDQFTKVVQECAPIYKREGLSTFNVDLMIQAVQKLTKKYQGSKLTDETYFKQMVDCPIASLAKGADRVHNLASMGEVFTKEKKESYLKITADFILPMIKEAQKKFPQQNHAFENIKLMLKVQIDMVKNEIKSP